mmetsp:Transcript_16069/g.44076  ORF Transcript_16069/g.44076 Transcript_16069/m.44076 type:complete len:296 (+) Transcript_16069:498-1385(+)
MGASNAVSLFGHFFASSSQAAFTISSQASSGTVLTTLTTFEHTSVVILFSSVPLSSAMQIASSMIFGIGPKSVGVFFFGHFSTSSAQADFNVASQISSGTNLNFSAIFEHTSAVIFCSSAPLSSASHTKSSMIFSMGSGSEDCFGHFSSKRCQAFFTASSQIGVGMALTLEHTSSANLPSIVASSSSLHINSLTTGRTGMLASIAAVFEHLSSKRRHAVFNNSSQTGVGTAVTLEHTSSTALVWTETISSSLHRNCVTASGRGKLPFSLSAALATTAAQAAKTRPIVDRAMMTWR